jgi:hypothetical protein
MEPEESMTCSKQLLIYPILSYKTQLTHSHPTALRSTFMLACTSQDVSSLQVSKRNSAFILIPPMRAKWTSFLFLQAKFQHIVDSNEVISTMCYVQEDSNPVFTAVGIWNLTWITYEIW